MPANRLFGALNALDGKVIGVCQQRNGIRNGCEFCPTSTPGRRSTKQLHLMVANASTHKHEKVHPWLKRHRRFHFRFTPTSSSWVNTVERFFRDLTQNRLRRGVFRDVSELVEAVETYIDKHNESPKPFIWTAVAPGILAKLKRARRALHNVQSV